MTQNKYKWYIGCFFCLLFGIGLLFRSQTYINSFPNFSDNLNELHPQPVALVFGGGVKKDGTLSNALEDRVIKSIELYKAGKVSKLLMTGDNGSRHYDEVTPMKAYAIDAGVPAEDIVLDYAGFRTYDSCYRARDIFGLTDVIAVSQAFHLPRILYICNTLGIYTTGYIADRRKYVAKNTWAIREFLAKFKAWYQVELTKPFRKYLGKKESVF